MIIDLKGKKFYTKNTKINFFKKAGDFLVSKIIEVNQKIHNDKTGFIAQSDENYAKKIQDVADLIKNNVEKTPIILLSGPSGSGKTTSALSVEHILDNSGIETHTLSLDNYFFPLNHNEKDMFEQGKLDLESPKRVDTDLLNTQLEKMINCEAVELPKFDFKQNKRINSGVILKRAKNEPIILEGIHSLNPDVVSIPDENTLKIYVSVRTRVGYGSILMHPSKVRLIRRIIRDSIYRNRKPEETIKMFLSVEKGVEKYIMPYKYRSDVDIDTFIPYELSVYKPLVLDKLKSLPKTDDIDEIITILSAYDEISESDVPKESLIREFIGNGRFDY